MFKSSLLLLCLFVVPNGLSILLTAKHARSDSHDHVSSVASAWYAGWHSESIRPSSVSWDKYTHVSYAFAESSERYGFLNLSASDPQVLPEFVATAHANEVKALLTVGGWTGSLYFSENVGSAENRTEFVKTLLAYATAYDLDGLDFDWEYPTQTGIGCNTYNVNDTANLLLLLQELRADSFGASLILTAAAGLSPWLDADGNALTDVSGFAEVLDWVAIMDYDVWGPWSDTAGPNAPLRDTCEPENKQAGSAEDAVAAWEAAGMPASQLVLGVAAYGHSFSVAPSDAFPNGTTTLASYPAFNASYQPPGDAWDDAAGYDECGNYEDVGGLWDFWALIEDGWLNEEGTVADGIAYVYDDCDETPRLYNETSQIYVAYDDATSFAAKGEYIKSSSLRGFAMWELGGDYHNILLDSIRNAAGYC